MSLNSCSAREKEIFINPNLEHEYMEPENMQMASEIVLSLFVGDLDIQEIFGPCDLQI